MNKNEIVLVESRDGAVTLPVSVEFDIVWLAQAPMVQLFGKDRTVIERHIAMRFPMEKSTLRPPAD